MIAGSTYSPTPTASHSGSTYKAFGSQHRNHHTRKSLPEMRACTLALALACALAVAHASEVTKETGRMCSDGKDNDMDGKADCQDPDCRKSKKCRNKDDPHTETKRECYDDIDNDGDGASDCEDTDCLKIPSVKKRCDKWAQNTNKHKGLGNGKNAHTETHAECYDHIDNDHDGKTDCQDSDCLKDRRIKQRCDIMAARGKCHSAAGCKLALCLKNKRFKAKCDKAAHTETGKECRDGKDNDGDGKTDCQDSDCLKTAGMKKRCATHASKAGTEHGKQCWDGIDNDHDGKKDCEDPDCLKIKNFKRRCDKIAAGLKVEKGRECLDYIDNDHDGKTDCEDEDCLINPRMKKRCDKWAAGVKKRKDSDPHTETGRECMDHIDNDHDGKVDCLDTNCMKDRRIKQRCDIMLKRLKPGYDNPKTETGKECRDGKDNDHDGKTDCQDPNCKKTKKCKALAGGGH